MTPVFLQVSINGGFIKQKANTETGACKAAGTFGGSLGGRLPCSGVSIRVMHGFAFLVKFSLLRDLYG
jgi:hypothetical protein